MKKILAFLCVSVFTLSSPVAVWAEEPAAERVDHYKHVTFESGQKALEGLNEKIAEISAILDKEGALEFTDLETVHEKSYALESAVDKMREEKTADVSKIDSLDEAVQAIHFASENQEEAKVKEWFEKLKVASAEISAPAVAPASGEETSQKAEKKEFYEIIIKDHKFSPAELRVPAGEKIKLIVDNQDSTPEEFESHDFNREKIIAANTKATIFIGPLEAGTYKYFGEFNMDSAQGIIIAE